MTRQPVGASLIVYALVALLIYGIHRTSQDRPTTPSPAAAVTIHPSSGQVAADEPEGRDDCGLDRARINLRDALDSGSEDDEEDAYDDIHRAEKCE